MTDAPSPQPKVHRRTKTGCVTCRKRHVKCDETRPACLKCVRGKRTCVFTGPASENGVPRTSPEISQAISSQLATRRQLNPSTPSYAADNTKEHEGVRSQSTAATPDDSTHVEDSPTRSTIIHTASPGREQNNPANPNLHLGAVSNIQRPMADQQLHRLVKFYVEVVGPWLDLSDAERNFTRLIPQEMFHFPLLFSAVIAFSAKQLCKTDNSYAATAESFYSTCVAELIAVLGSEDAAADGRVLAATVILRMYEMQHYASEFDPQQHLSGSWSLLQIPRANTFDKLRVAAFWVYLRQDIQMAERYGRMTIIDLNNCQFQSSYDTFPADDPVWANRIVWAYAHVINFCFGPDQGRTWERWKFQDDKISQWKNSLPSSFTPLFSSPSVPNSAFPAEWFLSEWHVLAMQTYHIAKLLLTLYEPSRPVEGLQRLQEQRKRDACLQSHARAICGICASNTCNAARIHACEHIKICRHILSLPNELEEINQIFRQVQEDTGWPTLESSRPVVDEVR